MGRKYLLSISEEEWGVLNEILNSQSIESASCNQGEGIDGPSADGMEDPLREAVVAE